MGYNPQPRSSIFFARQSRLSIMSITAAQSLAMTCFEQIVLFAADVGCEATPHFNGR
jgi:hypothetical protein